MKLGHTDGGYQAEYGTRGTGNNCAAKKCGLTLCVSPDDVAMTELCPETRLWEASPFGCAYGRSRHRFEYQSQPVVECSIRIAVRARSHKALWQRRDDGASIRRAEDAQATFQPAVRATCVAARRHCLELPPRSKLLPRLAPERSAWWWS
jgi:hypothetical protein